MNLFTVKDTCRPMVYDVDSFCCKLQANRTIRNKIIIDEKGHPKSVRWIMHNGRLENIVVNKQNIYFCT